MIDPNGKLFLAPHNDDETLFGFFTLLHHHPQVVIVLRGDVQGKRGHPVTHHERTAETSRAMSSLLAGCPWEQWNVSDDNPDWTQVEQNLRAIAPRYHEIWAPAIEDGGHDDHNRVGELADKVWPGNVTHYLTYRRGHGETRSAREVSFTPEMIRLKHKALALYVSQHDAPGCEYWFVDKTLREWYE